MSIKERSRIAFEEALIAIFDGDKRQANDFLAREGVISTALHPCEYPLFLEAAREERLSATGKEGDASVLLFEKLIDIRMDNQEEYPFEI